MKLGQKPAAAKSGNLLQNGDDLDVGEDQDQDEDGDEDQDSDDEDQVFGVMEIMASL